MNLRQLRAKRTTYLPSDVVEAEVGQALRNTEQPTLDAGDKPKLTSLWSHNRRLCNKILTNTRGQYKLTCSKGLIVESSASLMST